jgi:ferrous iron transport protein A
MLATGQRGRVLRVRGGGHLRHRIMEMGLVSGTPFTVERAAPLGDPIRIRLKGCDLLLRRSEAAHVEVIPE